MDRGGVVVKTFGHDAEYVKEKEPGKIVKGRGSFKAKQRVYELFIFFYLFVPTVMHLFVYRNVFIYFLTLFIYHFRESSYKQRDDIDRLVDRMRDTIRKDDAERRRRREDEKTLSERRRRRTPSRSSSRERRRRDSHNHRHHSRDHRRNTRSTSRSTSRERRRKEVRDKSKHTSREHPKNEKTEYALKNK